MTNKSPTFLAANAAKAALISSIGEPKTPLTIADAAARSGLALRDAEVGLHALTSEYRGHLRVSEAGDLVFVFPTGFTKPWETRDAIDRILGRAGHAIMGVLRFVVRAWVMLVLVGYALVFLAILILMMFARGNDNDSNRRGSSLDGVLGGFFRVLGDALFWTWRPFSPVYMYEAPSYGRMRRAPEDKTPFYEKVNRFLFGPTPPKEDPRATEQRVLAQIRAKKGRIGLADVMRVTGLPRDQADPMMARLMLDYDGDVSVSDEGAITYRFEALRKTAEESGVSAPAPAWQRPPTMVPLTGNTFGTNFGIMALNAFNVMMGLFALENGLTLSNLWQLFFAVKHHARTIGIVNDGAPIALGYIPILFSLALFVVPLARAAFRPLTARRVAREQGRLALLREVLTRVERKEPLTDKALGSAWEKAAGRKPGSSEITREVVALGGDIDLDGQNPQGGGVRYRFADIELAETALKAAREEAPPEEAAVGKIVFTSEQ